MDGSVDLTSMSPVEDELPLSYVSHEAISVDNVSDSIQNQELFCMDVHEIPSGTGIVFDVRFCDHENVMNIHPEQPARMQVIYSELESSGILSRVVHVDARPASISELLSTHEIDYLSWFESTTEKEPVESEKESIFYNQRTWECARLACGGALELGQKIATGELRNGFAVIRPPGHHAECDRAFGFCFLNNVAIVANVLQKDYGMERIMIVDWDAHHGNGTQRIFLEDPSILYVSIHRFDFGDFFPGSQDADMTAVGMGAGKGYTVNIPWSGYTMGDAEYMAAFHRIVLPIGYEFCPDIVIVSSGFDAAVDDPLGGYLVTPECYGHMTHMLKGIAREERLLLCLEGGYSLDILPKCVASCIVALLGDPLTTLEPLLPLKEALVTIETVQRIHSTYWSCFGKENKIDDLCITSEETHTTIGLKDMFVAFWGASMMDRYGMIRMPLPDTIKLDGDIYISPDVISTSNPIFVLVHSLPNLKMGLYSSVRGGELSNEDKIVVPELAYLERAFEESFCVIQILVHESESGSAFPEKQTTWTCDNSLNYLWDAFLEPGSSRLVILVGSGECVSMVSTLIASRCVEGSIRLVVQFPREVSEIAVPLIKSVWFCDHSLVLIPSEDDFGTKLPFSQTYGSCFATSSVSPVLASIDLVFDTIKERLFS